MREEENEILNFYDFKADAKGNIYLLLGEVSEVVSFIKGRKRTCNRFDIFSKEYFLDTDELERRVLELRDKGYYSFIEIKPEYMDVKSNNFLIKFKLMLLSHNFQLVEKIYDDEIISMNGDNLCGLFVHIVNVKNGKQFIMPLGRVKFEAPLIDRLVLEGYKNINDTVLCDKYIDEDMLEYHRTRVKK